MAVAIWTKAEITRVGSVPVERDPRYRAIGRSITASRERSAASLRSPRQPVLAEVVGYCGFEDEPGDLP